MPRCPTATHNPEEFTVTPNISADAVDPFISAGVVQVEPFDEVAKTGTLGLLELSYPTATNWPDGVTVTDCIPAFADEPFINAGVVQVEPFDEVA